MARPLPSYPWAALLRTVLTALLGHSLWFLQPGACTSCTADGSPEGNLRQDVDLAPVWYKHSHGRRHPLAEGTGEDVSFEEERGLRDEGGSFQAERWVVVLSIANDVRYHDFRLTPLSQTLEASVRHAASPGLNVLVVLNGYALSQAERKEAWDLLLSCSSFASSSAGSTELWPSLTFLELPEFEGYPSALNRAASVVSPGAILVVVTTSTPLLRPAGRRGPLLDAKPEAAGGSKAGLVRISRDIFEAYEAQRLEYGSEGGSALLLSAVPQLPDQQREEGGKASAVPPAPYFTESLGGLLPFPALVFDGAAFSSLGPLNDRYLFQAGIADWIRHMGFQSHRGLSPLDREAFFSEHHPYHFHVGEYSSHLHPEGSGKEETEGVERTQQGRSEQETCDDERAQEQDSYPMLWLDRWGGGLNVAQLKALIQLDSDLLFLNLGLEAEEAASGGYGASQPAVAQLQEDYAFHSGWMGAVMSPPVAAWLGGDDRLQVAAVMLVYDDCALLLATLEEVALVVDHVLVLVSAMPWKGQARDNSGTIRLLESLQRFDAPDEGLADSSKRRTGGSWRSRRLLADKLVFEVGDWPSEEAQRQHGNEQAKARWGPGGAEGEGGSLRVLVLDTDEFWHPVDLVKGLVLAAWNPHVPFFQATMATYWKSFRIAIQPPETLRILWLVDPYRCKWIRARELSCTVSPGIPVEQQEGAEIDPSVAICHHLSYVRTTTELRKKVESFAHADDVGRRWLEDKWLRWDLDHSLSDLHPTKPEAFKEAVTQPLYALPPSLRHWHLQVRREGGTNGELRGGGSEGPQRNDGCESLPVADWSERQRMLCLLPAVQGRRVTGSAETKSDRVRPLAHNAEQEPPKWLLHVKALPVITITTPASGAVIVEKESEHVAEVVVDFHVDGTDDVLAAAAAAAAAVAGVGRGGQGEVPSVYACIVIESSASARPPDCSVIPFSPFIADGIRAGTHVLTIRVMMETPPVAPGTGRKDAGVLQLAEASVIIDVVPAASREWSRQQVAPFHLTRDRPIRIAVISANLEGHSQNKLFLLQTKYLPRASFEVEWFFVSEVGECDGDSSSNSSSSGDERRRTDLLAELTALMVPVHFVSYSPSCPRHLLELLRRRDPLTHHGTSYHQQQQQQQAVAEVHPLLHELSGEGLHSVSGVLRALLNFDAAVGPNSLESEEQKVLFELVRLAGVPVSVMELPNTSPHSDVPVEVYLAPSHFVATGPYLQSLGRPVEVIHPPVLTVNADVLTDLPRLTAAKDESGAFRLGMLGRVDSTKGPGLFLHVGKRVMEMLEEKNSSNGGGGQRVQLLLAGEGHLLPAVKDLAITLGVANHTSFLGNIGTEDVVSFLASLHVMINTSPSETYGIGNVEALLTRTPVVATASSGHEESVKRGAGVLVRGGGGAERSAGPRQPVGGVMDGNEGTQAVERIAAAVVLVLEKTTRGTQPLLERSAEQEAGKAWSGVQEEEEEEEEEEEDISLTALENARKGVWEEASWQHYCGRVAEFYEEIVAKKGRRGVLGTVSARKGQEEQQQQQPQQRQAQGQRLMVAVSPMASYLSRLFRVTLQEAFPSMEVVMLPPPLPPPHIHVHVLLLSALDGGCGGGQWESHCQQTARDMAERDHPEALVVMVCGEPWDVSSFARAAVVLHASSDSSLSPPPLHRFADGASPTARGGARGTMHIHLSVAAASFAERLVHTPSDLAVSRDSLLQRVLPLKRRNVAYLYSRCDRSIREHMFDELSTLVPDTYALGPCRGSQRQRSGRTGEQEEGEQQQQHHLKRDENDDGAYAGPRLAGRFDSTYLDSAVEAYEPYRFVVAFENSHVQDGYWTEKIVNAFLAAAVPVYWGPADVDLIFNPAAFINCGGGGGGGAEGGREADVAGQLRACAERVASVARNETLWLEMVSAPPLQPRALDKYFSWHPQVLSSSFAQSLKEGLWQAAQPALAPLAPYK